MLLLAMIVATNAGAQPAGQGEVAPVRNTSYLTECGACHFAFQPGLLPRASWQSMLQPSALEDHFGDNAELAEDVRQEILAYLIREAADIAPAQRSRQLMASLVPGTAPMRITELRYIRRKHARIPAALIRHNPDVGSLSHCQRCHPKAESGVYDNRQVRIPGYGKWRWQPW